MKKVIMKPLIILIQSSWWRLVFSLSLPAMIYLVGLSPAQSQSIGSAEVFDQTLISQRINSEILTYRMKQGGDSAGVSVMTHEVDQHSLRLYEAAKVMVGGSLFDETIDSRYDFRTNKMESEEIVIDYNGKHTEMQADWSAKNQIDVKIGVLDSTIVARDHISRMMTLFLLPRLFYDSGDALTYRQFNLMDLQFREITATIAGQVELSLPLVDCDCYRVELRGGVANQDLFINPVTHRIVRIEIPEMGWVYDLLKIEEL